MKVAEKTSLNCIVWPRRAGQVKADLLTSGSMETAT